MLEVLAGNCTNFFLTSKASDEEGDFVEPYMFKWTPPLIPTTTLITFNLVAVTARVSNAINNGYQYHQSWGPFFGMSFLAFFVIVHLHSFLKGLMGRQNRTPRIVVIKFRGTYDRSRTTYKDSTKFCKYCSYLISGRDLEGICFWLLSYFVLET